jgi:hypothetical protein
VGGSGASRELFNGLDLTLVWVADVAWEGSAARQRLGHVAGPRMRKGGAAWC